MLAPILIVGCGSIGERHLRCFQKTGRAVVAACDGNSALLAKIARQYVVAGFAGIEEALAAREFAGVVICTPAHTHVPVALAALRGGAALLVEKPLSTTLAAAEGLQAAVARAGKFAATAYVLHFQPALAAVREILKSGRLGRPLQVSVATGHHFPSYRPAYREIYYARHETGGGAIQDALTHMANAVEWMVGPTTRVFCEAAHQALEGVTVEDTVSVAARNGGVLGSYALNQFQAPNETTLQVHCEGGSLRAELHEQRWSLCPRGSEVWEHHPAPVAERDDLFAAQAHAFLNAMSGQPTALATLSEAMQTLKFNLAALESARTGHAVEIA